VKNWSRTVPHTDVEAEILAFFAIRAGQLFIMTLTRLLIIGITVRKCARIVSRLQVGSLSTRVGTNFALVQRRISSIANLTPEKCQLGQYSDCRFWGFGLGLFTIKSLKQVEGLHAAPLRA
jgi:hypothetical protein